MPKQGEFKLGHPCPRCRSRHTWKKGCVPTAGGYHHQRYICFKCGKTFYVDSDPPITLKAFLKRMSHLYRYNTDTCVGVTAQQQDY